MFGVTIFGCWGFRVMLVGLNKKLEEGEVAWEMRSDVAEQTAKMEGVSVEEGTRLQRGFRYLV
jgi:hypothetical protein